MRELLAVANSGGIGHVCFVSYNNQYPRFYYMTNPGQSGFTPAEHVNNRERIMIMKQHGPLDQLSPRATGCEDFTVVCFALLDPVVETRLLIAF